MKGGGLKQAVQDRMGYICETPGCLGDMNSIHHILKVSVYPEIKLCYEFAMGCCGKHHAEIEQLQREGGDYEKLYPAWARLRLDYWRSLSKRERADYFQHCTFYGRI